MYSEKIKLEDLPTIIEYCQQQYNDLDFKADILLSDHFKDLFEKHFDKRRDTVIVHDYSIELTNSEELKVLMPSSALWVASCFWPYEKALRSYKEVVFQIINYLADDRKEKSKDIKDRYFGLLPTVSKSDFPTNLQEDIRKALIYLFPDDSKNHQLFEKFIYDRTWWFPENEGKKLNRSDVYESSIILASKLVVASSAKVIQLISSFTDSEELRKGFDSLKKIPKQQIDTSPRINSKIIGQNKIYYGAPGTGKSYDIEKLIPREQNIRTVFHADTQHGDFVGCLKPTMKNGAIEYSFAPGPFTTAIIEALNKPDEHIYLTIEEINRAPAASVFGDIFQLLDRDETGKSTYSIDITDRDWLNFLNDYLKTKLPDSQLSIPNNLSIYATMNSSDQAVMPLDTAFKRRWLFEYKSLDFDQPNIPHGDIPIARNLSSVPWAKLATAINSCLTEHNIPEDRLLGPWFITEKEINSEEKALATLTGKILNYIWDDVLRHQQRSIVFRPDLKTFAQVCDEINSGKNIYSDSINTELNTL